MQYSVETKKIRIPGFLEAESKEKHDVWDHIPEMNITSPYVHSRVDSNTFTMGTPMPESTFFLEAESKEIIVYGTTCRRGI